TRPHLAHHAIEPLRELHGVDGLDHIEQHDGPARLVRLQGPDEVPLGPDPGVDERPGLRRPLLYPVLAEAIPAGLGRRSDSLGVDGLRHRDHPDIRSVATAARGSLADPTEDFGAIRDELGVVSHVTPRQRSRSQGATEEARRAYSGT